MLGLDVDESFTAAAAQEKAVEGSLRYAILLGKVVSGK